LRVDDNGNEIVVKVKDADGGKVEAVYVLAASDIAPTESIKVPEEKQKDILSEKELIEYLTLLLEDVERMPNHEKAKPLTHYDFRTILLVFLRFLKCD
jgi:t-SNARE complex subunit (syntaxin)